MKRQIKSKWRCHGRVTNILITVCLVLIAAIPPLPHDVRASLTDSTRQPIQPIEALTTAIEKAKTSSNAPLQARLFLERGEIWRTRGHLSRAEADFSDALSRAREQRQQYPLLEIAAMESLGYIHYLQQNLDTADSMLRAALEKCAPFLQRAPSLAASCANRLGNVLSQRQNVAEARAVYEQALQYAMMPGNGAAPSTQSNDPALEAAIHRNIAHVVPDKKEAFDHLSRALNAAHRTPSPQERITLLLDIASEAENRDPSPAGDAFRYHALQQATTLAHALFPGFLPETETPPEILAPPEQEPDSTSVPGPRLLSLCYGKMGALYESRQRIDEAIPLTEQAISTAGTLPSHDLLMQWEWQLGRLLKATKKSNTAVDAYERALFHLDALRQGMEAGHQMEERCFPFPTRVFTIYTELADILLEQSAREENSDVRQQLLETARDAVERGKQSELRDYFQDPCIDAGKRELSRLAPGTGVVYPVILPDRLEVLTDIGGRLHRHAVAVSRTEVEETVGRLATNLRNNLFHKALGQTVYSWLVSPLMPLLMESGIDTLVFVPDGVFRMIPMAALWDGETFLASRFAVVTEPGLTLFDPKPLPRGSMTALIAGMSEPGPVIMDLPATLWHMLCRAVPNAKDRRIRGISVTSESLKRNISIAEKRSLRAAAIQKTDPSSQSREKQIEHVREILKLPGVAEEVEHIASSLAGDVMMNERFILDELTGTLLNKPFEVIHIASHGFFGGSSEENFIMTYDRILNIDHMEAFIRPKLFAARPVELITLSACQTAEGDDRSPLGLSGVALKSGARSVLGSLWPVSDSATQTLLSIFYDTLKNETISKAEALRRAQLKLIHSDTYHHPFHWAPFILIGNWL